MEGGNIPTRLPSRSGADVINSAANPSHESVASTNARTAANPSHESTASTNARTAANTSHESAASSNARNAANGNNGQQQQQRPPLMEHEQFLPIANIIRIMRRKTPPYGKISDGAKETMQECASEFICFITSEASEKCRREQRKTVTAEDLLWAMSQLGFDDYVGPLTLYLNRYREVETGRTSVRGEPLVRRRVAFQPTYGMMTPPPPTPMHPPPMYGGTFDMGLPPLSGMFDALGGRPMDGAEMGGPMNGPVPDDGTGKYYFGDGSGASSSSGYPPLPEFDPYAKFK